MKPPPAPPETRAPETLTAEQAASQPDQQVFAQHPRFVKTPKKDRPPEIVTGGGGQKRAFLRSSLRLLHRRVPLRVWAVQPQDAETAHGDIVLLHGWGLNAQSLDYMVAALGRICPHRRIWRVTYDTNWTAWEHSARDILNELRAQNPNWHDTILVGYSMGGIVARSIVAQGFEARAVVTLCSPHHGPLPYLIFPGPRSLSRHNVMMRALNENPRDIEARARLHCLAIVYRDLLGSHHHDGMVAEPSALGSHLGPVASRHSTMLHYSNTAWYDPHWRGKDPYYLPAALEAIAAIDAGREPEYSGKRLREAHLFSRKTTRRPRTETKPPPLSAKRGDLLLFTSATGLNRLITWFTHSRFYHVGLYEGDDWIVEARPRGVVRRNLRGPDGDRHFVAIPRERVMTEEQSEAALSWAASQLGDGYDPLDVAAIILERLFKFLKINYTSPDKYSCGEFVTRAMRHAGVDPFPGCLADRVVPSDFERFLGRRRTGKR